MSAVNNREWVEAFEAHIKTRPFEQFNLMMFEQSDRYSSTSSKEKRLYEQQKLLLNRLLMEEHHSVGCWSDYCDLLVSMYYPESRYQLQRLVNKAIEILPLNAEMKKNKKYISLHLHCARLKG